MNRWPANTFFFRCNKWNILDSYCRVHWVWARIIIKRLSWKRITWDIFQRFLFYSILLPLLTALLRPSIYCCMYSHSFLLVFYTFQMKTSTCTCYANNSETFCVHFFFTSLMFCKMYLLLCKYLLWKVVITVNASSDIWMWMYQYSNMHL